MSLFCWCQNRWFKLYLFILVVVFIMKTITKTVMKTIMKTRVLHICFVLRARVCVCVCVFLCLSTCTANWRSKNSLYKSHLCDMFKISVCPPTPPHPTPSQPQSLLVTAKQRDRPQNVTVFTYTHTPNLKLLCNFLCLYFSKATFLCV